MGIKSRLAIVLTVFATGLLGIAFGFRSLPAEKAQTIDLREGSKQVIREEANAITYGTSLKSGDIGGVFRLNARTRSTICQSFEYSISISEDDTEDKFILGYYDPSDYHPLTFVYTITKADGSSEEKTVAMEQKATSALYDSIGVDFGNDPAASRDTLFSDSADIFLKSDETIDPSSLKIVNIFAAVKDSVKKAYVPDYTKPYYIDKPTIYTKAKVNYEMKELINVSIDHVSSFNGTTSIVCNYSGLDKAIDLMESRMKTAGNLDTHLDALAKGKEAIRNRFLAVSTAFYQFNYKDGTSYSTIIKVEKANEASNVTLDNNGGKLCFLIKNVDAEKVQSLYLKGLNFRTEFYDATSFKAISASGDACQFDYRFGAMNFETSDGTAPTVKNVTLLFILALIIYTVVYAALAVAYFFYRRNKYKNDEYLRVVPKMYLKDALIAYFGLGCLLSDIIVISNRVGDFRNNFIVKNPFDSFIMIFSVALIIFIGYYIKFFFTLAKNRREKKKSDALHLNDTKADDGTVVMIKKPEVKKEG
jgi:flagellar basal body-associated protein FliL